MINVFRKIRKKLADDNKPLKYARYAIGEIVLVMIGILLALQVNNWNEDRKERIIEQEVYNNLLTDINKDRITLKERMTLSKNETNALYDLVHNAYTTQKTSEDYINLLSHVLWNADNFILQDKTFDELVNSGKLAILKDKSLKNRILEYYKSYDIAATHIAELNQTSIDMLSIASEIEPSIKYMGLKGLYDEDYMFISSDWDYINDPTSKGFRLLEQAAGYYFFKNQFLMDYFKKQDSLARELVPSIHFKIAK
ncbi:DUF6090 family protein [uncultured Eudoraea sp.]|uniref:DUF6090 family protein n=1 Tax=uncultured Eudoraea sp. TaxID=1035614 RepID=UPI00261B071D|nr:DUF6090 family protein [uncultured Eudoraea sp.]